MNPKLVTSFYNMTGTEPRRDFFFPVLIKMSLKLVVTPEKVYAE